MGLSTNQMPKITSTKDELITLIAKRARDRYAIEFTETLFNDLLKDHLMFRPRRGPNIGKRPTFIYGRKHYRRALQLVRLVALGFESRDAQRLALFLKGYGLSPGAVRKPLSRLYPKLNRQLFSRVRSTYLDKPDVVPEGRKIALLKNLGEPDPRLLKAGFTPPADFLLAGVQVARQQPLMPLTAAHARQSWEAFTSGKWDASLLHLLSGLLLPEAPVPDDEPDIDYVEKLIIDASDNTYYRAREIYRNLQAGLQIATTLIPNKSALAQSNAAIEAILGAARTDPAFMVLIFVTMLRIAREDWSPFNSLAARGKSD
jgi:hypothetical protein